MYTILVTKNNELTTSIRERIMQRSKLVDNLHFLVDPDYKGIDMSGFDVTMEYVLPISREYKTEALVKSDQLYKGMIEYRLPLDTNITKEHGNVEIQLTFTKTEMDADGNIIARVRKTSKCDLKIIPIEAWSNYIVDSDLTALDQRIIMAENMINALNDMNNEIYTNKADNLVYDAEKNTLQLSSNGVLVGSKVVLNVNGNAASAIQKIFIDDNGTLIAIYNDGSQENVGKINGSNCAGVYVPSLMHDKLIFTLQDTASDKEIIIDIDPTNEWVEEDGMTNYIWEYL